MVVCPLTLEDCQEAAKLHQNAFFKGWSDASFQELLGAPLTFGIQLRKQNRLLGYVLWRIIEDEAEILTIVIVENARRTGVGSALLKNVCEQLKRKGVHTLFLEVAEDNDAALCFYQKHGFVRIGKRENYYARENNKRICAFTFQKKVV